MNTPDWQKLHQEDPDNFDKVKREYINQEIKRIAKGDERREWNLRLYQKTINDDLNKYKDPIAKYNRMIALFWEGVRKFYKALPKEK